MSITESFHDLGLSVPLLSSLTALGYETPTPVQARTIPILLSNNDLLAQAQTGTGKTAAFALPILSNLDITIKAPQALVIAPTRELAIQVAEAFQSYAKHLEGFHVAPIYGGQDYKIQLRALKRGSHVIVGTPGRVMDHLNRGTLRLDALKTIILDEADEMLNMGFIDDVETILKQIPHAHQTALFSATIPSSVQKIANRYLKEAQTVSITPKQRTVDTIEQFYIYVRDDDKLNVLTRLLEVEDIQAAIIFTRTKNGSTKLAEKLQARGYVASALNGDMNQAQRTKVMGQIKNHTLDIIVATDVAARGIDIEHVSHVINFDIPHDTESYIHRIGRTGRAGRAGKALLFVTSREYRLLENIQNEINNNQNKMDNNQNKMDNPLQQINAPSLKEMHAKRGQQLTDKITDALKQNAHELQPHRDMIANIMAQSDHTPEEIATALAYIVQQSNPLIAGEILAPEPDFEKTRSRSSRSNRKSSGRKHRPYKSANASSEKNRSKKSGKRKHFKDRDKGRHS